MILGDIVKKKKTWGKEIGVASFSGNEYKPRHLLALRRFSPYSFLQVFTRFVSPQVKKMFDAEKPPTMDCGIEKPKRSLDGPLFVLLEV